MAKVAVKCHRGRTSFPEVRGDSGLGLLPRDESVNKSLLFIRQLAVVEPVILIEFGQTAADFLALLRRELGRFLQYFGLAYDSTILLSPLCVNLRNLRISP